MKNARKWLISFLEREHGAAATEYSVLVCFIALVIVVGVGAFGVALNGFIDSLATALKTALGVP